ncbi:MAG: TPM domain-containing protein [Alphaproteobacteria bacterium]|nr:TPM domain-containing protein [Alphaproteobacteria bacterium]
MPTIPRASPTSAVVAAVLLAVTVARPAIAADFLILDTQDILGSGRRSAIEASLARVLGDSGPRIAIRILDTAMPRTLDDVVAAADAAVPDAALVAAIALRDRTARVRLSPPLATRIPGHVLESMQMDLRRFVFQDDLVAGIDLLAQHIVRVQAGDLAGFDAPLLDPEAPPRSDAAIPARAPVVDLAGILDAETTARLQQASAAIARHAGVMASVLTIADARPERLGDFAVRVRAAWSSGRHDEAVIVAEADTRSLAFAAGYGLERHLAPDRFARVAPDGRRRIRPRSDSTAELAARVATAMDTLAAELGAAPRTPPAPPPAARHDSIVLAATAAAVVLGCLAQIRLAPWLAAGLAGAGSATVAYSLTGDIGYVLAAALPAVVLTRVLVDAIFGRSRR